MSIVDDKNGRELRRHRDTMAVIGVAIILFGFWSVIKAVMYIYFTPIEELTGIDDDPETMMLVMVLGCIIIAILLLTDLLLRVYIGRRAIKAGKRRSVEKPGIKALTVLLSFNVISMASDIPGLFNGSEDFLDTLVTSAVDLTSVVMIAEMLYAAIRIRKILEERHAD